MRGVNPFGKDSRISDLYQLAEVYASSYSFASALKSAALVVIAGFVAAQWVPALLVTPVVAAEVTVSLVTAALARRRFTSALTVEKRNAPALLEYLRSRERFHLHASMVRVAAHALVAGWLLTFHLEALRASLPGNLAGAVGILVFVATIIHLSKLAGHFIRYRGLSSLSAKDYASLNQQFFIIKEKSNIITMVPPFLAFIGFMVSSGMPLWIGGMFLGFLALFVVLSLISMRRVGSVDLPGRVEPDTSIKELTGERILAEVFGIIFSAAKVSDIFRPTDYSFLGKGKQVHAENTLVATDQRLLMVHVPIGGGDNIVGGYDPATQSIWNHGEIREQAKHYDTPSKFVSIALREVPYKSIQNVRVHNGVIVIEHDGGMLRYGFMDVSQAKHLVAALGPLLGTRLTDKTR